MSRHVLRGRDDWLVMWGCNGQLEGGDWDWCRGEGKGRKSAFDKIGIGVSTCSGEDEMGCGRRRMVMDKGPGGRGGGLVSVVHKCNSGDA